MHIPMTTEEISKALCITYSQAAALIKSGKIGRSICCPYRPLADLDWSSVYDVLEYVLASGQLDVALNCEQSALWVTELAELDQDDCFSNSPLSKQVAALADIACDEGLEKFLDSEIEKISHSVLTARADLLSFLESDIYEIREIA